MQNIFLRNSALHDIDLEGGLMQIIHPLNFELNCVSNQNETIFIWERKNNIYTCSFISKKILV